MQRKDRIDGSPHDEACANIDSHGTANNSSPSGEIRPSPGKRTAGVVPLFLVKQIVAAEISRYGAMLHQERSGSTGRCDSEAVREIHVVRTGCHYYAVTTLTAQERPAMTETGTLSCSAGGALRIAVETWADAVPALA